MVVQDTSYKVEQLLSHLMSPWLQMRKKANMRKEQETNFEEKRMNLSLDEEREVNKENERNKYVKDPYYDQ